MPDAALQQAVTQLKAEKQGHLAQMDTLRRENSRLKDVQEQQPVTGRDCAVLRISPLVLKAARVARGLLL